MNNLEEAIAWFNRHPMKPPRDKGFSSISFVLVPAMEEAIQTMIKVSLSGNTKAATDWLHKWGVKNEK